MKENWKETYTKNNSSMFHFFFKLVIHKLGKQASARYNYIEQEQSGSSLM